MRTLLLTGPALRVDGDTFIRYIPAGLGKYLSYSSYGRLVSFTELVETAARLTYPGAWSGTSTTMAAHRAEIRQDCVDEVDDVIRVALAWLPGNRGMCIPKVDATLSRGCCTAPTVTAPWCRRSGML